ncbi:MAG: hypothetical protein AB1563_00480, partial [Bacillota bacterium]
MAPGAGWQLVIILSVALAVLGAVVGVACRRRFRRAMSLICPDVLPSAVRMPMSADGQSGEAPGVGLDGPASYPLDIPRDSWKASAAPADSGTFTMLRTRNIEGGQTSPPAVRSHAAPGAVEPAGTGSVAATPSNLEDFPPARRARNLFLAASASWKSDR